MTEIYLITLYNANTSCFLCAKSCYKEETSVSWSISVFFAPRVPMIVTLGRRQRFRLQNPKLAWKLRVQISMYCNEKRFPRHYLSATPRNLSLLLLLRSSIHRKTGPSFPLYYVIEDIFTNKKVQ